MSFVNAQTEDSRAGDYAVASPLLRKRSPATAPAAPATVTLSFGQGLMDAPPRDPTLLSTARAPLKPTTEMLTQGARAGGVSVETAWAIYVAMLNAAP